MLDGFAVLERFLTQNLPSALVLTAFVTTIAYIHSPRMKVLVFSMPVPFTCAYLATGRMPINATHVVGLFLVVAYHWIVFSLRAKLRVPLAAAILGGVGFYLGMAALARPISDWPFWPLAAGWLAVYLVVTQCVRGVDEPGHRSSAPWQVKAPTIFVIAITVYALKGLLAGAVTTFPYAGVFTSYEMRKSLRTLASQFTINVISIASMLACMYATQDRLPGYWPLAVGWLAVFITLAVIYGLGIGKPPVAVAPDEDQTPPEDAPALAPELVRRNHDDAIEPAGATKTGATSDSA